jgi:myo-inositol-1(or 4)-monophosphatase
MAQTPAEFDIGPHVDAVTDMVRAASTRSLDWYRRLDRIDNKDADGFDPVTAADRAVEEDLRSRLAERFPDHAIMGEEFGLTGEGPFRWTIDPIDGTRAFITGQPMWGTLLGFQVGDEPVAGWLHVPVLGETYVGHQSCRFMTAEETREVAVSTTTELGDAVVLCTHPDMFAPGEQADAFGRVAETAKMVRYSGDCVNYGLLAMGLADSVIENGLAAYDIIPLIPIVRAAGGIVTDLEGNTPMEGGYVVASATEELHRQTLAMLRPS